MNFMDFLWYPNNVNAAVDVLLGISQDQGPSSNDNFIGPLLGPSTADDDRWNSSRGALNAGDTSRGRHNSPAIEITDSSPQSQAIGLASSNFLQDSDKANWALVRTSQNATGDSVMYGPHPDPNAANRYQQHEDELSKAISASLQASMIDTQYVSIPLSQHIRPSPFTPVSLRAKEVDLIPGALLVHALYHIPQIRDAFRKVAYGIYPKLKGIRPFWLNSMNGYWRCMAEMEMTLQADVTFDDWVQEFNSAFHNDGFKDAKEHTEALYKRFADNSVHLPPPFSRNLLHSIIWYPRSSGASSSSLWSSDTSPYFASSSKSPMPLIPISANINSPDNELINYLHEMTWTRKLEVAADILDHSALKNLRTSIKYFETVTPEDPSDPESERKKWTLGSLKRVLETVEHEISNTEKIIKQAKEEVSTVFNITGLQKHPYDLRAVLMWDGVYGRGHFYSYVQGRDTKWYKTVEASVTEVTEGTVLTDIAGLHFGAGPFMLFYSRCRKGSSSTVMDEEKSQETAAQSSEAIDSTDQTQRVYASMLEELSQWHPTLRMEIAQTNAIFREQLEKEGIIDSEGRVLQNSTDGQGQPSQPRALWEDPLSRMDYEDMGDPYVYDDDPIEMEGIELLRSNNFPAGGDYEGKEVEMEERVPALRWETDDKEAEGSFKGWNPSQKSDIDWDEVLRESKSLPEPSEDDWTQAPSNRGGVIEVQVTRTVETSDEKEEEKQV
ncbi:hypothetical protein FRC18_011510 [Serendipita sp. 400]|nr:hypothetical protein FRC18_011510 [Serendipita sp. 400]